MKIIAQTAGFGYLCELTHKEVQLLHPLKSYSVVLGDEFDISVATKTLEKIQRLRKSDILRTQDAVDRMVVAQEELTEAYASLMLLHDIENSEKELNDGWAS